MQNNITSNHGVPSLRSHLVGQHVDWNYVKSALADLPVASEQSTRGSEENDPMGRALLVAILSKDPSIDVIEACLRAFPDALVMNISACFMASRCHDLNVIRSMIRYQKRQSPPDTCPYPWISMSHVSVRAAEAIIEEYPQGVLEQCIGSKYCLLDRTIFSVDAFKHRQPDASWYDKLILMLKAAEHVQLNEKTTFHPIHTLVHRVVTRAEFFKKRKVAQLVVGLLHQLRLKDVSLFRIVDKNGDTPLHVVLRASCQTGPGFPYAQDFITVLVDANRKSASLVTREGRLALHHGLENGWPCHEVLLRAAPHSLHRRDPITGLYPFQLAACAKPTRRKSSKRARSEESCGDLDVIYSLLRQDPLQACWGLMDNAATS